MRRLILESLRYWVEHMHVDGFRFDLASILSRGEDGEPLANPPILWSIESDPVLSGRQLIAEAWDAGGLYQVSNFVGDRWAVWNGRYRDSVRRFVKGDPGAIAELGDVVGGSPSLFDEPDRDPTRSINFVAAHDGFTLRDLVSYDAKHNWANGQHNTDGANDNFSWNCGVEGPTDDLEIEGLRQRQMRNLLTILLMSQGRPLLLMGDEVSRTQGGNNNAFDQDNEISWFDWDDVARHADLLRFTRLFVAVYQRSAVFRDRRFWFRSGETDIVWHGVRLNQPDWSHDSHTLAYELENKTHGEHWYVMLNAYWEPLEFELPPLPPGQVWCRLVDTALPAPADISETPLPLAPKQRTYALAPRSAVVLTAAAKAPIWQRGRAYVLRMRIASAQNPDLSGPGMKISGPLDWRDAVAANP